IFSRPFTGKLMDTRGANIVTYPGLVLFAIGMFLFSQATAGWMLLLAAALIGIGYGNFNSIAQSVAVKVTPPHRFGLATSTYFILYDIGLGVGPFLLGFVVPYSGYRPIFLSMVFLILICIPIYYLLHGRRDKELLKIS
ncbi:MAG: MFS transporter, partial [Psychrobacillus sp.]